MKHNMKSYLYFENIEIKDVFFDKTDTEKIIEKRS